MVRGHCFPETWRQALDVQLQRNMYTRTRQLYVTRIAERSSLNYYGRRAVGILVRALGEEARIRNTASCRNKEIRSLFRPVHNWRPSVKTDVVRDSFASKFRSQPDRCLKITKRPRNGCRGCPQRRRNLLISHKRQISTRPRYSAHDGPEGMGNSNHIGRILFLRHHRAPS